MLELRAVLQKKKQRRGTQVTPHCFQKNGFGDYEEVWDLENPSLPPLHAFVHDRQKREECCRQSGSCGSGKPVNPSHQHAPLGTIHCGFAKNLPDFRSPNTIVFYIRLFKERLRIREYRTHKVNNFSGHESRVSESLIFRTVFFVPGSGSGVRSGVTRYRIVGSSTQ